MKYLLRTVLMSFLALLPIVGHSNDLTAIDDDTRKFGPYTVYFSIIQSRLIPAEVANVHNLVRASDQSLINVSIKETTTGESVKGTVSARATNLMQQSKTIKFKTIEEPDVAYYLGSLRHTNEELFHIDFTIDIPGENAHTFRVTRKLYTE